MRVEKLTLLQFAFLSFSFVYGGTLLAPGAYAAGEGAWLAALLGCGAGVGWLFFLGRWSEAEKRWPKKKGAAFFFFRLTMLVLLLLLLFFSLGDFGTFCSLEVIPSLSPALCAMTLFAVSLYAVFRGVGVIGRFAELSAFLLLPLLLLLFPGLLEGDLAGLGISDIETAVFPVLKSGLGVFVSMFGDCLALSVLAADVISLNTEKATVFARASAQASREIFFKGKPFLSHRHPIASALVLGGGGAAVLLILTVIGNQVQLGAEALAEARYPTALSSALLHKEVLNPFFLLCLMLLYTVKAMVLLSACFRLLSSFLPKTKQGVALALISMLAFSFFLLLSLFPNLLDIVKRPVATLVILLLFEFGLPLFYGFFSFIQKRFDKRKKV